MTFVGTYTADEHRQKTDMFQRLARTKVWLFVCVALSWTSLPGCATQTRVVEPPTQTIEPGIYDVATSARLPAAKLWEELEDARFVLVAESHDSASDHAIQLHVLRELAARGDVALGMEMFQRPFQGPLDAYVRGDITEEEMLRATQWEERWGFATELYRPLWTFAADRGIPVIALNVRRELTKRISKVGLDALTEFEHADLPEIDRSGERYRAWMREIFRSHGAEMDDESFERFYQAQITWDETMAETAVAYAEAHPNTLMVIVVGRGHVERDFGIPSRIRRRIGAQPGDGTVVSIVPVDADAVPRYGWMRRERFADYVWVKEATGDGGQRTE